MRYCIVLLTLLSFASTGWSQTTLDKTIAKVGDEYILLSELEYRYREEVLAAGKDNRALKCDLLFTMVREKMLVVQAGRDSISISEEEINQQMEQRLAFFTQQFGSEKAIEKYFGEPMAKIQKKLRATLGDQLLVNRMQQELLGGVTISPLQVRKFYKSLPKDSLPEIETQFEIGQITMNVSAGKKEKKRVKRRLSKYRNEILAGDLEFDFAASLYSEDPGSAQRGGDLGWASRNAYVPEFAAAAFKLKKDSISGLVETEFGFHIIKLLDRKGDRIHCKHILIKPQPRPENKQRTRDQLDSIRTLILADSITFERAAYKYSQDEESRNTGGMLYDLQTGSIRISAASLQPDLTSLFDTMTVGTIATVQPFSTPSKKNGYRIVYLKEKVLAHNLNLDQDYSYISELASGQRKEDYLQSWTWSKASTMYISVGGEYLDCKKIARLLAENKKLN